MKEIYLLIILLISLFEYGSAQVNNEFTVAGGNGFGSATNQLWSPYGIFLDQSGNIYIADRENNRIQKWAPGAGSGVTVAGGNGQGSNPNQLWYPYDVAVDNKGNIFIADWGNSRIQKWERGAAEGSTVAVFNGNPYSVFVDAPGNLYFTDRCSVRKLAPGGSEAVIVAGGNGCGTALNQLNNPTGVFVDSEGSLIIADRQNHRIQKWKTGASTGTTIAGGNGEGAAADQLSEPWGVFVDDEGYIYIADYGNHRVQKWEPGAKSGVSVAEHSSFPTDIFLDPTGAFYIVNNVAARVTKYIPEFPKHLSYKYYEGDWEKLPDFNTLAPVKSGFSTIDLTIKPSSVEERFGILWEGFIYLTTAGTYKFSISSDDGSKLYFNSGYSDTSAPLVDNDGLHGDKLASGTVNIDSPGVYPIAIAYFNKTGNKGISVYWSGPTFDEQIIPASAFVIPAPDTMPPGLPANLQASSVGSNYATLTWSASKDNTGYILYEVYVNGVKKYTTIYSELTVLNLSPNTDYSFKVVAFDLAGNRSSEIHSGPVKTNSATAIDGLIYKMYRGDWDSLPEFDIIPPPVETGRTQNIQISQQVPIEERFAMTWEGYINIPTPGIYIFSIASDDGSRLYFNTPDVYHGTPLVDNNGLHGFLTAAGTVDIAAAGYYPITVSYFNKTGFKGITVSWSGPGFNRQAIPDAAFTTQIPLLNTTTLDKPNAMFAFDKNATVIPRIYPNPFIDKFQVALYNYAGYKNVSIVLTDMNGRRIITHHAGRLPAGNQTVTILLNATPLVNGFYMVMIYANGNLIRTQQLFKGR